MLSFKLITSVHAIFIVICILKNSGTGQSLNADGTGSEQKSGYFFPSMPMDMQKFIYDLQAHGLSIDVGKIQELIQKKYPPMNTLSITLQAPGFFDYFYLAYDIAEPLRAYYGYTDEEISDKELCKRLFGAATGFVGSVVGASVGASLGAYCGTLVSPGWGSFIGGKAGGIAGGQFGYNVGKEIGKEYLGECICEFVIRP